MIISSGYNIAAPEVEEALLKHPEVAECAVVGVPDEARGLAGQGVRRADRRVARHAARRRTSCRTSPRREIAPYKYPRAIEFVDELPRTATGKLQRFRLRQDAVDAPWRCAPRQLILSLYGLYAREEGDWLSVASLIALMADLGADSAAVRSSVSRLKRRGVLEAARRDGQAGYALSRRLLEVLREGDHRIWSRPRATAADGWLVLVFSVPESERERRHALRSLLSRPRLRHRRAGRLGRPRHAVRRDACGPWTGPA